MYKQNKVKALVGSSSLYADSQALIQLDFNNCCGPDVTKLRKQVKIDLNLQIKVVKNTILAKVIGTAQKSVSLENNFTKSCNLVIFVPKTLCIVESVKQLYNLLKSYDNISFHNLIFDGYNCSKEYFEALSSYPSREQAINNVRAALMYSIMHTRSTLLTPLMMLKSHCDQLTSDNSNLINKTE